MKNNLLHILSHTNGTLDSQVLLDYLDGKLSDADQHTVEEWLEENNFAADALEGLREFGNKEQLQEYVAQLNRELSTYLSQRKQSREKRKWKDNPWTYLAILLVLIILVAAYGLIRLLLMQTQ